MSKFTAISATILGLLAAAPGQAASITASDPAGMLDWFQGEGIVAKLEEDNQGDPKLSMRYYGTNFAIYFYGCNNNRNCQAIQYVSGYKTEDVSLSQLNEWNRDYRYMRSYKSNVGSVRIEYDLFLGEDGMSGRDFSDAFDIWTRGMENFEKHINW